MLKWLRKLQAAMAITPMHNTYAAPPVHESELRRRAMIADREREQREKCVEILMRLNTGMTRAKAEIHYDLTPPTRRPGIIHDFGTILDDRHHAYFGPPIYSVRGMPTSHVPVHPPVVPAPRQPSKPDLTLVPADAIVAAASGFEAGLGKYERDDWKSTVTAQRCLSSLIGHATRLAGGETVDPESGRPTHEHIMARAAMLSHLIMREERDK